MATKKEILRTKKKSNRVTIDTLKMGPEPLWQPGESNNIPEKDLLQIW